MGQSTPDVDVKIMLEVANRCVDLGMAKVRAAADPNTIALEDSLFDGFFRFQSDQD